MLSFCFSGVKAKYETLTKSGDSGKIFVVRVVLLAVLVAAAGVTTWYSYYRLFQNETDLFVSRFDSTADNALNMVVDSFERMSLGIQEISSTFGHDFPNADEWPNVAWTGFHPTATLLNKVSSVNGIAMLPIVRPEQVASYESFIANYYENVDPYCSASEYLCPMFTPGAIWGEDYSTLDFKFYPDRFGNTTSSPHKVLTPMSQYLVCSLAGPNTVGYNLHGDPVYTETIDLVIDCVADQPFDKAFTECGAISPAVSLPYPTAENPTPVVDDMVAVLMQPIFPVKNCTVLTGFAMGGISWKALLSKVVPRALSALQCVVRTDTGAFTFRIEDGEPSFEGPGDLHDHRYSDLGRTIELLNAEVTLTKSSTYELSIYPTSEFDEEYRTSLPVIGAVVMMAIFLFCSVLFVSYDVLSMRRFNHNEAVLDTKRRFVRFISHEIRTPLNTVRLGMKLLEVEMAKFAVAIASSSPANMLSKVKTVLEIWKQLADEILESSESAVEVLNDLLNYDKIEIGTMKLEFGVFPMRDLVQKTVAAMQVQAQQKDITIDLQHKLPTPTSAMMEVNASPLDAEEWGEARVAVGDLVRMRQVLRNLISNALKFTADGGLVEVSVDISAVNDPVPQPIELAVPLMLSLPRAGTVRIAVKDSGAGLSPQQLAEICAEGVQFNANELQAGQGSGLGLFISKGIVEQHGGKLVVTSEGLGKGAQFTIILPLFSIDPQDSLLGGGSSSGDITRNDLGKAILSLAGRTMTMETSMQILDLHPQRLLVVDDSALNRKMLVRLLTSKDHTCEQAEDGEVAVRKYLEMVERGEPPDAILMDYEMPVMNGPTATARLRELGCACLIVGVTGNVLPHDVAFFKERGADAVMPKPVVLEDFEHLLLQRLNAAPTASSGERGADGSVPSVEVKRKVQKSLSKPVGGRRVHVDQEVGANVLN